MTDLVSRFIEALHRLEDMGDVEGLANLFGDDATVANPVVSHEGQGRDAAEIFWRSYRGAFESVRSEFRNVTEAGNVAFLEWVSIGATREGPFRYGGVSVIEHRDGKVTAFRSYFDPAHLRSSGETRRHVEHETPVVESQKQAAEEHAKGGYQ